jgi:DHA3 family macrolide efflux protein-like MFS transporter
VPSKLPDEQKTNVSGNTESGEKPSYRRVLATRPVLPLWISQVISESGDYVFNIALLWYVLSLTHSTFWVAITQGVIWLPLTISGPIAGVYVDKFNRRDLILVSNLIEGVIVGSISIMFILDRVSIVPLLLLVFFLYTTAQFLMASILAIIPRLVKSRTDLGPVNSLFSLSTGINKLISYATGGIIVLFVGFLAPIIYDGFTFFIAALIVVALVPKLYGIVHLAPASEGQTTLPKNELPPEISFKDRFKEGVGHVRKTPVLVELIMIGAMLNFFLAAGSSLVAPYTEYWLNGNSLVYGLMTSMLGLGTLSGSLSFGKFRMRQRVGKVFLFMVLIDGITVSFFGVSKIVMLALALMFIVGFANSIASLSAQVLIQAIVPGELLGRVFTVLIAILQMATPVAALLSGSLALVLPIGLLFSSYGLCLVAVSAVSFAVFGKLRKAAY